MKKTIRNYERVRCPDCNGDGFYENYKECVKCQGAGAVTKKIILSQIQKAILRKFENTK